MAEMGQKCVKYLMFFFNLIFTISGLALVTVGAMAQADYLRFFKFMSGTLHTPALLISIGVVVFVISFLGCCGAIREHYYMLMGFSVLLGFIFLVQVSAGITSLVEKRHISDWIKTELSGFVENYHNATSDDNKLIDDLQRSQHCCGILKYNDYQFPLSDNATKVPESCCRNTSSCERTESFLNTTCTGADTTACPIWPSGCQHTIEDLLDIGIDGVVGVALGLAVFELIGVIFACLLATRIRKGYTYV